jgi:hypothetical protein
MAVILSGIGILHWIIVVYYILSISDISKYDALVNIYDKCKLEFMRKDTIT